MRTPWWGPVSARIAWIVVRLLLVLWMGERGLSFYYQGF
jgi:ammonia channel protein AmtB